MMTSLDAVANNLVHAFDEAKIGETFIVGTIPISDVLPNSILDNDTLRSQIIEVAIEPIIRKNGISHSWAVSILWRDDRNYLCLIAAEDPYEQEAIEKAMTQEE